MTDHKRVVLDTLDHLYACIPAPSATDRERHRIARMAVDRMEPEAKLADLAGMNIAQVQAEVEAGRVTAVDALAFEEANGKRKSLITWLEERE